MRYGVVAAMAFVIVAASAMAGWSGFQHIPNGTIKNAPSVAIDGTGRIFVFGRGFDGALWSNASKNGGDTWSGWSSRGGVLLNGPACAAPYADSTLDCYVITTGGVVSQIYRNNEGWSGYSSQGGMISSNLALVATAPDHRMLFGIGNDAKTFSTKFWSMTTGWQQWQGNQPFSAKPGWAGALGCGGVPGNSTQYAGKTFTDFDYVCMTVANGSGKTVMVAGGVGNSKSIPPAFFETDYVATSYHPPAVIARSSPRTGNGNVGITADIYMTNNAGAVLNGVYVVGKGWDVKPTPMNIPAQFKSGLSCARRNANGGVKAICAGTGMDDQVWFMTEK